MVVVVVVGAKGGDEHRTAFIGILSPPPDKERVVCHYEFGTNLDPLNANSARILIDQIIKA